MMARRARPHQFDLLAALAEVGRAVPPALAAKPQPAARQRPAPKRRFACGHVARFDGQEECLRCAADAWEAAQLAAAAEVAATPVPAVLTIRVVDTGKLLRFSIPTRRRGRR